METQVDFEGIWQDYQASLKSFLHSKIANQADVDDLLQDILIKTHNNIHTLKKAKSAKAWLANKPETFTTASDMVLFPKDQKKPYRA